MSKLEVDAIEPQSGTTLTLGASGDAVALGSGASVSGLTLSDNILFNAASKGIYLGVTTPTASNLLDDYEEGTWTPTFQQGYTGITYANQYGWYRKVGSLVVVSAAINFSGTADGNDVRINLPFTQTVLTYGGGGIPFCNISDFADTNPYVGFNVSYLLFYELGTGSVTQSTTSPTSDWVSFVISMATS